MSSLMTHTDSNGNVRVVHNQADIYSLDYVKGDHVCACCTHADSEWFDARVIGFDVKADQVLLEIAETEIRQWFNADNISIKLDSRYFAPGC